MTCGGRRQCSWERGTDGGEEREERAVRVGSSPGARGRGRRGPGWSAAAGDGEDNVGRVRTLSRTLATSRASPARFRAPGGRGRSGEAESIIGLSRGAPCAANRRRWRRHYGGHAEEPREGFDPGFTGEMRGREGGQRRGRPLDHASTEGGGLGSEGK